MSSFSLSRATIQNGKIGKRKSASFFRAQTHRITDLLSLGRNEYFFIVTFQEVKERRLNENVNIVLSIPCGYDEIVHLVKSPLAAKFHGYLPLFKQSTKTRVICVGGTISYVASIES